MQKSSGIVFIGGRDRGLECLQALIKRGEVILHIFCLKEDIHEREKYYLKIQSLAKKKNIPCTLTTTVKHKESIDKIKKLNPILIIVMGWRTIIPKEILEIPVQKTVAVHESLLPQYRGFAPINWVIINGESQTGVTLFFLDDGVDTGDIIDQITIPISKDETASQIYQKTKQASVNILIKNLDNLKKGSARATKQIEGRASYCAARTPEDGMIDWRLDSIKIFNTIRALSSPYPGAFSLYKNKKIIIQQARLATNQTNYVGRIPGRIVKINKDSIEVLTGDGSLEIIEIETSNGISINAGLYFKSIKGSFEFNFNSGGLIG